MYRLIYCFLLGSAILPALGCRPANESQKIAEVDGAAITQADLDRSGGKALSKAREQLYKLERQKLDEHIGATLLTREAKTRNVSVTTLLEQEVNGKVPPITDEEIQSFYVSHKDRLRVEFAKVHDQIRDFLREQKSETQKKEFFTALRSKAKVTTYLKPPPVFRVEVAFAGAPLRGAEKAAVTIIKFEDFQCPYCKTVQPTFRELLKRYDGKVKLVHKDLPLDEIHPQARSAAEAARCAGEQGKFWEYHDKLYAQTPKLGVEDLKSAAKEVGLNLGPFEQCFTSGKFKGAVQKDVNEGANLGLTGTPAFFINGREISGAQPVEAFAAIIDEELGQAK
ncbi:MAG: Thioredoxin protein [Deltaproteobacteria bacterium]|nr:Thioredoxin protein [Deltaproteobacteria bacterium]